MPGGTSPTPSAQVRSSMRSSASAGSAGTVERGDHVAARRRRRASRRRRRCRRPGDRSWPRARAPTRGRRRAPPAPAAPRPGPAAAGGPSRMRAGRRSAPGPTTGAARSVVTVTTSGWSRCHSREQALDLGALHRGRELRVRAQGDVLGQRDRVVRPMRRTRWRSTRARSACAPTAAAASSTCRVPLDVDPRHQRLVGDRVDDAGEVHDHVDALEQRRELGSRRCRRGGTRRSRGRRSRLAHVESDDPIDVGMVGEHGEERLPDETGGAGDGDRKHTSID